MKAKTTKLTARRQNDYSERLVRCAAAARINSMEAEKLFLQNLFCNLSAEVREIFSRIELIDDQITAEKASVKPENDYTGIQ